MPQNKNEANEENSPPLCNIMYAFTRKCTESNTNS